jgi:hypothetical protein
VANCVQSNSISRHVPVRWRTRRRYHWDLAPIAPRDNRLSQVLINAAG